MVPAWADRRRKSLKALPATGEKVAKGRDSYENLAESIHFRPDQETLAGMMRNAGMERMEVRNLSGGIVAIHAGRRL